MTTNKLNGCPDRGRNGNDNKTATLTSSGNAIPVGVIVGKGTVDYPFAAPHVEIRQHSLGIGGPSGWEEILHQGPKFSAASGGKRVAATDLAPVIARLGGIKPTFGGGVINSARAMAQYLKRHRLSLRLCVVDSGAASPEMREEMERLGVQYCPLGLSALARSLVVTNGGGRAVRWILTEALAAPAPLNGEWHAAVEELRGKIAFVLVNSVKSAELAMAAIAFARHERAPLFSVLTCSTPFEARKQLLAASAAATFSLEELIDFATWLNIDCAGLEEHFTSAPRVAEVIEELLAQCDCAGGIVVTMGEVGVVIRSSTGTSAHISLTPEARALTRSHLSADQIPGIGDDYAGEFALDHVRLTSHLTGNTPLIDAARNAWIEVLKNRTSLELNNRDFRVTVLGHDILPRHRRVWLAAQGITPNISWSEQS